MPAAFGDQIAAFTKQVTQRESAMVRGLTDFAFESIRDGSPNTASPGQPVDDGDLYKSWTKGFDNEANPRVGVVSSDATHANAIEQGVNPHGPVHFHHGGGPGSVAATIHAFTWMVEIVAEKVAANG
jgi:hypothetical protein